mmetsp:Transcript_10043/g.37458  ORF Transcript_10043/g.37458 Transcript_10043/m.37458 type:complete len:483 (-) Transcript_10043:2377-3825(-)|eukprot:CAMPEP_0117439614 /NCGR_PEP_ID=MMETSP0759-20121206/2655_1 /TAXON_ID=63605 /ORGANISM="Percolomonas cosmopolitus, Strain WS" /LENGTH=482 /DNA_ID=CAMNT_0005231333 /DNA_START=194 /DNA_END=1642 /DNA_ORIENTATION=+
MSSNQQPEDKQSKKATDSIFSAERQQDKKSKLVKDPTAEEMKAKREKEREYAVNITKAIDDVRQEIEGGADVEHALERLHALEKQTRKAGQGENTTNIAVEIVRICGENKNWSLLNKNILAIAKKRNQIKQAIQKLVQESMTFLDQIKDKETKVELINTLRQVCEGKIYVEVEQAHLVRMLSNIKEDEGNIEEAANLIQTIQVETIGSMPAAEKIELILMQIRLCLAKKDFVRAYIISRKITSRAINRPEHKDLKIRFYNLLIQYWNTKKDYLEIARCNKEIFDAVKNEDSKRWEDILKSLIIFICLAPYDNAQNDLMHRVWDEKRLDEPNMRLYKQFLRRFVEFELINGPNFQKAFGVHLKSHPAFAEHPERQQELQNRIVEHNLRIIAKYYERVHVRRLSELLSLGQEETESFISRLVTNGTIRAKIDRIEGVVNFRKARHATEILNSWQSHIEQLLGLVERSNLLIDKEVQKQHAQKTA